jgi:fructoselysine-6-P-deglycase FrlB-like protein
VSQETALSREIYQQPDALAQILERADDAVCEAASRPLVAIVPGQLWAFELAVARGCDPDHPRGLSKVTLTR